MKKRARSWEFDFRDHMGIAHRLAAFPDKGASVELKRKIAKLVALRQSGDVPDEGLALYLRGLPERVRRKLRAWDLLVGRSDVDGRTLRQHLDGYAAHLTSLNRAKRHVELTKTRIAATLDGAGFVRWTDIAPGDVTRFLAGLRDGTVRIQRKTCKGRKIQAKPIGIASSNGYLAAFKAFCKWMVRDGRASQNPVEHLTPLNAATDRRRERRALTTEETTNLIQAADAGPEAYGMTGPERALLYALALTTGLRQSEIRSLTKASFQPDGDSPTVTVRAAYSKRRREDAQGLHPATVPALKEHLNDKLPMAPAFAMPPRWDVAAMLRADLAAAKIPHKDDAGRIVGFHALRHSFITLLATAGVHPKTAQDLARHSSIELTMQTYTHTRLTLRPHHR